jgi:hypothetical protein
MPWMIDDATITAIVVMAQRKTKCRMSKKLRPIRIPANNDEKITCQSRDAR